MAIYASIITAGTNNHTTTAEEANAIATDLIADGVVGAITNTSGVAPATGSFAVNAQGTPDMTVAVSAGQLYGTATPSGQGSQTIRVRNTASANVTIAANSTGSTKYDFIYVSIDATNANEPDANASDVATLVASRSSSATSDDGTPPTYGVLLAVVTVANGASSISNASITDKRLNAYPNVKTASAVNRVVVQDNTTGNAPSISATGDDTNISLRVKAKGTGTVQPGTPVSFYATTTQAITNTITAITTYTEVADYGSNFASGVFTAPYAGVYHFSVNLEIDDVTADNRLHGYIYKNTSTVMAFGYSVSRGANNDPTVNMSITIPLAASDTVSASGYSEVGSKSLANSSFSGFLVGRTD